MFFFVSVPPAGPFGIFGETCDFCEAALPSSSCHLWAAGRSGSVSQLSVPPLRSLKHAAACYTQGKTAWTEIKWNPRVWLCASPSAGLLFILLLPTFMFCSQVSRRSRRCRLQTYCCGLWNYSHIFFFPPFFGFFEVVAVIRTVFLLHWKFHSFGTSPTIHTSLC